ncbi:MAG: DegT/DnrJ/EryC1/StrS family aminotransferase [Bacteroidota bacterium]
MIQVTKPFLPPKEEVDQYLQDIWDRNWLTNDGPLVNQLEDGLKDHLGVQELKLVNNGTVALQLALKALDLNGEIITTPFSYIATTSIIVWENCTPVFADIDPKSFNIDPAKLEAAITENTSAILATHVYGNPCDVEAIERIAKKHGLKVIYDAAHCFGTTYKGESILNWGDVSAISFHATKVYHTVEGGAVVCKDKDLIEKVSYFRNFGHDGPAKFNNVGINAKNSEMHAAMGLVNLKYVDEVLRKRASDHQFYKKHLASLNLEYPEIANGAGFNHSYFPVLFESEQQCESILQALADNDIHARRYFYPVLSKLHYLPYTSMPEAEDISSRILCLPLYFELKEDEIERITEVVIKELSNPKAT